MDESLYDLTGKLKELQDMAMMDDVDPEVLRDTMEAVEGEFDAKAEGYAKVIHNMQGDLDKLDKEIQRLTARRNTLSKNQSRIKQNLETAMIETGRRKFRTALFSFSIQRNPASVQIPDWHQVPSQYLVFREPVPDKKAIKTYLEEHGPRDWAYLEQGESLRIR